MIRIFILLSIVFHSTISKSFELAIIQGISNSKQTFITRMGKKNGVFEGKKATFTAENVSIIAKAIKVSREFTQWKIINKLTNIPFKRGQIVTYYDTQEYLWALSPEEVQSKYIKTNIFHAKSAIELHSSLINAISETVSGVDEANSVRGGIQLESFYEKEFNSAWAMGIGLRYAFENIQTTSATLSTQRLLGILETRYRFPIMRDFYRSRFGLSLGVGYGQSSTQIDGITSSGTALLLPSTKFLYYLPLSNETEVVFEAGFENLNINEEFGNGDTQTTTLNLSKFGIAIRRYF